MKFLQENTSFITQNEETVYRYSYRITDEGPEDLETKFEEEWYTGRLNRITGEGPVCCQLSEQGIGIPVKPTGLPVDYQVPIFNRPFTLQTLFLLTNRWFLFPTGKPFLSSPSIDSLYHLHSLNLQDKSPNLPSLTSIHSVSYCSPLLYI